MAALLSLDEEGNRVIAVPRGVPLSIVPAPVTQFINVFDYFKDRYVLNPMAFKGIESICAFFSYRNFLECVF